MSNNIGIILTIIYAVVAWIVYHKIFSVYYFDVRPRLSERNHCQRHSRRSNGRHYDCLLARRFNDSDRCGLSLFQR